MNSSGARGRRTRLRSAMISVSRAALGVRRPGVLPAAFLGGGAGDGEEAVVERRAAQQEVVDVDSRLAQTVNGLHDRALALTYGHADEAVLCNGHPVGHGGER